MCYTALFFGNGLFVQIMSIIFILKSIITGKIVEFLFDINYVY